MKTYLIAAAAALGFATPAAAQPASAPAPAATCTPEHAAMGHCKTAAQPADPVSHQGHQTAIGPAQASGQATSHGQMSGCCRDANGNGKMDCCENMGAAAHGPASRGATAPQSQAHQSH